MSHIVRSIYSSLGGHSSQSNVCSGNQDFVFLVPEDGAAGSSSQANQKTGDSSSCDKEACCVRKKNRREFLPLSQGKMNLQNLNERIEHLREEKHIFLHEKIDLSSQLPCLKKKVTTRSKALSCCYPTCWDCRVFTMEALSTIHNFCVQERHLETQAVFSFSSFPAESEIFSFDYQYPEEGQEP